MAAVRSASAERTVARVLDNFWYCQTPKGAPMIPNASRPIAIHFQMPGPLSPSPSLTARSEAGSTALMVFAVFFFAALPVVCVSADPGFGSSAISASSSGSASSRVSARSTMSVMIRTFLLLPFVMLVSVAGLMVWLSVVPAGCLARSGVGRAVATRAHPGGCAGRPGC
ncbi:Uncharacterised protein [Mycobacteroides abscessus subsp. massiliense]|nr:Uncharacterised protein [Mycobacteroides abscessus subsp. massiliense]